jgi:F-type H+-transporting ATPase subunit c
MITAAAAATTTSTLTLGGPLVFALAAIGPGIGIGLIFAAYINGVARQPEANGILRPLAFLGFALTEVLALIGLVFAFL